MTAPGRTLPPPGIRPGGPPRAAPSANARRPARRRVPPLRWPLSASLLVLLLAGCTALGTVLAGSGWWWVLLVIAAAVLSAAAGFRRARVPAALVPVLSAGALVVLLTLVFGGGTGVLWLIPTGDTFARFTDLATSGVRSIQTQGTPAQVLDGILFLLACGVGLLAILMDVLAIGLRWPALAGIPPLVPLAVPGFVIDTGAEWGSLVATAVVYLLMLRVDARLRGMEAIRQGGSLGWSATSPPGAVRGALAIGAIGIAGALVIGLTAPIVSGVTGGSRPNSALFGGGVSPMINLGQDLRRPAPTPALHYRTTASEQPYLALLTLDDIKGTTWLPRPVEIDPEKTVEAIDDPPGLSEAVTRTSATTTIAIDGVRTDLLPVPVPATSVDGLTGEWFWNNGTRAITSPDSSTSGQRYTVTSLEVQPTREQLRQAGGRYPAGIESSLALPEDTPGIIAETAGTVTAGAESNYDAAVALQDYLRGNDFSYDTEAPVEDGYDGGGGAVIATFLEVKRGYCVHFSSAMALMARSLGIPARISLGYLPGTRTTTVVGGLNRYNVDSDDLHAWPELYFTGVGWVPFEPTPGRGSVPDYALPESSAVAGAPESGGAAPVAPRPNDNPGITGGPSGTVTAAEDDLPGILARVGLLVAAALVLLAVPGTLRAVRRRRRRRLLAADRAGAVLAWRELTDTALDHGVSVYDTLTARELAAAIRDRTGVGDTPQVRDALERMLVAVERAHYARQASTAAGGAELLDDLDAVIRAVRQGGSAAERVRATVAPASLGSPALRRMGLARDTAAGPDEGANQRTPTGA
jgi:transglutaminase-like putative cysteine protease